MRRSPIGTSADVARDRKPGDVPDVDEIRREALERIRQLKARGLVKEKESKEPMPTAYPELWPGGPGVDTGDIMLARRVARKRARRTGYA